MSDGSNSQKSPDKALDGALARALRASLDISASACPEPEILAAYFERSLPGAGLAAWEPHFSSCARCQQHLAMLARSEPSVAPEKARPMDTAARYFRLRFWLAPALTAAAAVAFYVTLKPQAPRVASPVEQTLASASAPAGDRAGAESQPAESLAAGKLSAEKEAASSPLRQSTPASADVPGRLAPRAAGERGRLDLSVARRQPRSAPAEGRAEIVAQPGALASGPPALPAPPPPAARAGDAKLAASDQAVAVADKREAVTEAQEFRIAAAQDAPVEEQKQLSAVKKDSAARNAALDPDRANRQSAVAPTSQAVGREAAGEKEADKSRLAASVATHHSTTRQAPIVVAAADTSSLWRLPEPGFIEYSTDGGRTWKKVVARVLERLRTGSAPSASVCWLAGDNGVILRTTDGTSWASLPSPTSESITRITAADSLSASITTASGKRFVTSDGGQAWKPL